MNLKKCQCPYCKNSFDTEEEQSISSDIPRTQLSVGDLVVATTSNDLEKCKVLLKELVRDKSIHNYLNSFQTKKIVMAMKPGYIE